MLKKLVKTALTAATILAGASAANAASVGSAYLNLGSSGKITVIAEDGKTYSKLQSSDLNFNGNLKVSMNTGRVQAYSIALGVCGAGQCGYSSAFKTLHRGGAPGELGTMEFDKDLSFDVSTDKFPQGLSNNVQASKIFQACNSRMSGGGIIKSDKTFTHYVKVSLGLALSSFPAEFEAVQFENDWIDHYTVPVTVTCKALQGPKMPGDVAYDFGDMKVRGIKLFLTTYSHAYSRPNPGTKCKKAKLLVRLNASKKGAVRFKLWEKVGNSAMTSKVIDAWASHDGNGGFKAEYSRWVSVDKTTYVQAKAEELVNPIGLSTPWEDITLHCTSAGGGGLTVNPSNNDDDLPPVRKLTGDFSFIDNGSPKCERTGKALINFKTTAPAPQGNVHWSLDCTNGKHISGVAQAIKHPKGGYIAPALASFQITKTSVYSCALKSVAPKAKTHQWKSHKFDCVKRNVETGANDLTVKPRPNTGSTRVPATLAPATLDKAKADAIKRRREAAKKAQAETKRKREATLRRAKEAKKKTQAEARRKREAAIAKRKAIAAALAKRKAAAAALAKRKAVAEALARRRAATALAKRKAVVANKRRIRR